MVYDISRSGFPSGKSHELFTEKNTQRGAGMKEDLLQQIEQMMPTFSKSQKLIANYILNHYEKA